MSESKTVWNGSVLTEWVDYNGHMTDAAYATVFSHSLDALMETIGLDAAGRKKQTYTIFTLEAHIKYLQEAHDQDPLETAVTILDRDAKRMHLWFEMKNANSDVIATSEQMVMGMDESTGRPGPFPEEVKAAIEQLPALDQADWPKGANVPMGIRRK
ncbi:thioesterase family protein [Geomicrobium sediminis]|uniref:Acyl-CoA thioester hydrolase n=1 Tax=Geomicrobium sediminis TaxID=1347788 RepID=A0ABS2PA18_9BACL|nr:thioesterase family protein [Geomicrobium sediminis]MBM7632257.1 acyl-CoA thioester hydrolase [Geomicrobium sediminis]